MPRAKAGSFTSRLRTTPALSGLAAFRFSTSMPVALPVMTIGSAFNTEQSDVIAKRNNTWCSFMVIIEVQYISCWVNFMLSRINAINENELPH